jgi:hypothetical protein
MEGEIVMKERDFLSDVSSNISQLIGKMIDANGVTEELIDVHLIHSARGILRPVMEAIAVSKRKADPCHADIHAFNRASKIVRSIHPGRQDMPIEKIVMRIKACDSFLANISRVHSFYPRKKRAARLAKEFFSRLAEQNKVEVERPLELANH